MPAEEAEPFEIAAPWGRARYACEPISIMREAVRLNSGSFEALFGLVERIGLRRRRSNQLHIHVVERVDQDDESLGGVSVIERHDRNVVDDDGVIFVRDAQIIGGGKRLLRTDRESEPRHPLGGARNMHGCGP